MFGQLLQKINYLEEFLILQLIFLQNEVLSGKCPFFVTGTFYTPHSICLNIGIWQAGFV